MDHYRRGFELIMKTAARKETKLLKGMLGVGKQTSADLDPTSANQFLQTMKGRGYQPREHISHLGSGGEGIADLVAHDGMVAAKKTYNPYAQLYSPEIIANKADAMRSSQRASPGTDNPLPQLYKTDVQKGFDGSEFPVHYTEFIPHQRTLKHDRIDAPDPEARDAAINEFKRRLSAASPRFDHKDYADTWQRSSHGSNVALDKRTGQYRAVDFMPAKVSEGLVSPDSRVPGMRVEQDAAARLFPNMKIPNRETMDAAYLREIAYQKPDMMRRFMSTGELKKPGHFAWQFPPRDKTVSAFGPTVAYPKGAT